MLKDESNKTRDETLASMGQGTTSGETWLAKIRTALVDVTEMPTDEVDALLNDDDTSGQPLANILAELPPSTATRVLSQLFGVDYAESLAHHTPSHAFIEQIPITFARQHGLVAFANNDELLVAVHDLNSWGKLDILRRMFAQPVPYCFAPNEEIQRAINLAYQQKQAKTAELVDSLDRDEVLETIANANGRQDLLSDGGQAPVIKLVNLILFDAVKAGASDVHIQPYENQVVVRMRIDGVLFDAQAIPKDVQDEISSRVKVLARMDIAEKRLPQDGRATVQVGDRLIDLRVSSLPTCHGERIVIRLLDKSLRLYTLEELGMATEALARFRELIRLEHGLILVTGPTGSGKSTTLYAALQEINAKDLNVVTIEDPIEYQLEGISQTQVSAKKGMTFASGLRTVLRQDPDIIMVGEIRDEETAMMAIQSALTGHLVFSTLHTNDAASAVTRLLELGIEPYLVSSSVIAVLAQRLVRRFCSECKNRLRPEEPSSDAICEKCRGTGYSGRVGIYELLTIDDVVRDTIQTRANATQVREVAVKNGMKLLRDDGETKAAQGLTTLEEVSRVTMRATL